MNRHIFFIFLLVGLVRLDAVAYTPGSAVTPKMNLVFVENKGQLIDEFNAPRKDIQFKLNAGNVKVYIGDGQIHYQWSKVVDAQRDIIHPDPMYHKKINGGTKLDIYRLDVRLLNANTKAEIIREDGQEYYERYYLPQCDNGTIAHSFQKITYKDIYPGIDWVLYVQDHASGDGNGFKYDFVVHAGADASQIKLKYEGATGLDLKDGAFAATTPRGTVREQKPYSYDAITKQEIPSAFVLNGDVLSFNIEDNGGRACVIDPTLNWATFVGSDGADFVNGVAADPTRYYSYVAGYTTGTNIATFSAHQNSYFGAQDGYVVQLYPSGTVRWATYYGGNEYDLINDIATDASGYIYFTGVTTSKINIATSTGYQPAHGGSTAGYTAQDAFLVKMNSDGARIWGTYFGDSLDDMGYTVTCDVAGNIFIGGHTESMKNMVSPGAFKSTRGGGFIAKFNSAGARQWSTYFGDTGATTYVSVIKGDATGENIYVGGATESYLYTATAGSFQPNNGSGSIGNPTGTQDGFLARFNTSGQQVWSTYYGGYRYDIIQSLACDGRGGIYIGGTTNSADAIATPGTYSSTFSGITCSNVPASVIMQGFLAKFNAAGQRQWGTYYGTSAWSDFFTSIIVLPNGAIYVGARREFSCPSSTVFIPNECYLLKFDPTGNLRMRKDSICATIASTDLAYARGKLYFAGSPFIDNSTGNPTTPWATNIGSGTRSIGGNSGGVDGYIQQLDIDTIAFINIPFTDTLLCTGDSMHIPYDVSNKFLPTNTISLELSNSGGSFTGGTTLWSTKTTDTTGTFHVIVPPVVSGTKYRFRLITSAPADTSYDDLADMHISPHPVPNAVAIFPICAGGILHIDDSNSNNAQINKWTGPGNFTTSFVNYDYYNVPLNASGWYVLTEENASCIGKDSVYITVYPYPAKPKLTTSGPLCTGDTLKISAVSATPGANYNWLINGDYFPEHSGDTMTLNVTLADTVQYIVAAQLGGCLSPVDSFKPVIRPTVVPGITSAVSPIGMIPEGNTINYSSTTSNGGSNAKYQWMKNGSDIPGMTLSTFSGVAGTDIKNGDIICVRLTSNATCAKPTTAVDCDTMTIVPVHVARIERREAYSIYPNPNDGNFTLKINNNFSGPVTTEITDAIGNIVYRNEIITNENILHIYPSTPLPDGMYFLRVRSNEVNINERLIVKH